MARKSRLDKETVVQAAVDLINRDGVGVLSLGQLAQRLGVQTPSLYNHIDGLPGLQRELALCNARNVADVLTSAAIGRSGADALRAMAQAYRTYIKSAPGLYLSSLRASGNEQEPDRARQAEEERALGVSMAVMASFGLQGDEAIHAVRALRSVVHGFATLEVAGGFGIPLEVDESFRRLIDLLVRGLQRAER
jgi:AcrR family transcriptional regulator